MYIGLPHIVAVGALVLLYLLWRAFRRASHEGRVVGGVPSVTLRPPAAQTQGHAAAPEAVVAAIAALHTQITAMKAAGQDPAVIRALEDAAQKLQSSGADGTQHTVSVTTVSTEQGDVVLDPEAVRKIQEIVTGALSKRG